MISSSLGEKKEFKNGIVMSRDNLSDSKYKRKSLLEYALVVFFLK